MSRSQTISVALLFCASLASACDKGPATHSAPNAEAKGATKVEPTKATISPEAVAKIKAESQGEDPGAEGTQYGAALAGADAVTIEQVMDAPTEYENKVVRVEGMVTDVCTKRGCWFEMAGERPGMKMRFKVRDGDMVFPPSAKGKKAIAEGTVSVRTMTLEQTRAFEEHMAKDAGKELDPETITEPMTVVQLTGHGAVIRDS